VLLIFQRLTYFLVERVIKKDGSNVEHISASVLKILFAGEANVFSKIYLINIDQNSLIIG
jgi:hypothetical protein